MNLNARFFSALDHCHRQPTVGYRSPSNNQQYRRAPMLKNTRTSFARTNVSESFLPSVTTMNGSNIGQRPYRRNDFANNHLFIAKQKLAHIFLGQPTMNIQGRNDLIHLFDRNEPGQKTRRINKNKREENNSHTKTTSPFEQDPHLSVVNLIMTPSLPSIRARDPFVALSRHRRQAIHCQTKATRPSIKWRNPAMEQHARSTPNYTIDDNLEPNTIIHELIDNNPDIINSTMNPLNASLLYVKSIIPSAGS